MRNRLIKRRYFDREAKRESRVFCPCELCCLRYRRMLYPRSAPNGFGQPIRFRRIPGYEGNFVRIKRDA
jgi:hypothetical protein